MSTNQVSPKATAAEIPQPAPTLTPEVVVDQLRALRAQLGEVTPLTSAQRKALRGRAAASNSVLQASINVIGALENVSQAVGQPAADVRQMDDEANRWTAVEDELRKMLKGVAGANLVRFQRPSSLTAGLPEACAFYHVHTFAPRPADEGDVLGVAEYGEPFASVVARDPLFGVQFHPEKSSVHGLRLLENFAAICARVAA